jgi:hypothetical protein
MGVIEFRTLNGSHLFTVNIEDCPFAAVVPWVREQTCIAKLMVVRGCEPLDESCTFKALQNDDVLNVVFEEGRLPVLDINVFSAHGHMHEHIDLAKLRIAGHDTQQLQALLTQNRLKGYCSYDRWELTYNGQRVLCNDRNVQPTDLKRWLDSFSMQGPLLSVCLQMLLPIVQFEMKCGDATWVEEFDLHKENIITPRQLLQHAVKAGPLGFEFSKPMVLNRNSCEAPGTSISELDADLDAPILMRGLRNYEVLTASSLIQCTGRVGGEMKRVRA